MIRGRLRRRGRPGPEPDEEFLEIDPHELTGVFAAPPWLRDLGLLSWLLVGIAAALIGAVWLLALMQTIVIPLIVGAIVASVASPVVGWLKRHRVPRAAGAALVLLGIAALGAGIVVLVLGGIISEGSSVSAQLQDAADNIAGWLKDAGVSTDQAEHAKQGLSSSASDGFHTLLGGLTAGIDVVASLAIFLSFTVLITFFMLKDGPTLREFVGGHLGVPKAVGETIISRTGGSLQSYFLGMTIVSAFSAVVVGIGVLALEVNLAGTIIAVTFLGGYVPYLGAWLAGIFAVLMALGSGGLDTALAIGVIVLLANGILQQLVQPIAYGATLNLHPLAVLVVTIAGGALFGAIGLILAAPLTSAAVKITTDLERARAAEGTQAGTPSGAQAAEAGA
jgi:putative heme transporter